MQEENGEIHPDRFKVRGKSILPLINLSGRTTRDRIAVIPELPEGIQVLTCNNIKLDGTRSSLDIAMPATCTISSIDQLNGENALLFGSGEIGCIPEDVRGSFNSFIIRFSPDCISFKCSF